jgi:hypothetical protein
VARNAYWEWVADIIGPPTGDVTTTIPEGESATQNLKKEENMVSPQKYDSLTSDWVESERAATKMGTWRLMVYDGTGFSDASGSDAVGEKVAEVSMGVDGVIYRHRDLPLLDDTPVPATPVVVPITDANGYMLIGSLPYGRGLFYDGDHNCFLRRGVSSDSVITRGVESLLSSPVTSPQGGGTRRGTPGGAIVGAYSGTNTPMLYGGSSDSGGLLGGLGITDSENDSFNFVPQHPRDGDSTLIQDTSLLVGPTPVYGTTTPSYQSYVGSEFGIADPAAVIGDSGVSIDDMLNFTPEFETGEWGDAELYIQQFYNPLYSMDNDYNNDTFVDVVGDRGTRLTVPDMYSLAGTVFNLFGGG